MFINNQDKDPDKIKELMADKIKDLQGQGRIVSRHCVSPENYGKRNVIDIGYAAIIKQGKNKAFVSALISSKSISNYINEPGNSCHHIEIAQ